MRTEDTMEKSSWRSEILSDFIQELELIRSPQTVLAYKYDVGRFLDHTQEFKVKRLAAIKPHHVTDHLASQKKLGKSDATVFRYHMSLASFFAWLYKNGRLEGNPMQFMVSPRIKKSLGFTPTQDQIVELMSVPDPNTEFGSRDLAMMEVAYSSGLRVSELGNLEIANYSGDSLTIVSGKGNKTRTVPLNKHAISALNQYIKQHRGMEEGYLFVTKSGCRIGQTRLSAIITEHGEKIGIYITTHTLRRACATHLLEQGADIRMIQELLGHASIGTTQIYAQVTSKNLSDKFFKYQPERNKHG